MDGPIELEVAAPDRPLAHEGVDAVSLPGSGGYLGILPGHAPLAGRLGAGVLSYWTGSRRRALAVAGGFVEVLPGRVCVVADTAEPAEEIDLPRARAALERAQRAQAAAVTPEEADAAAAAAERAAARILATEGE
jgi:F-type H+-transporting ATPase subunit epsilon